MIIELQGSFFVGFFTRPWKCLIGEDPDPSFPAWDLGPLRYTLGSLESNEWHQSPKGFTYQLPLDFRKKI